MAYALVSGAAKRLGKLCAIQLAKQGYNIILHYSTSQADAEATRTLLTSYGVEVSLWRADLSDPQALTDGMQGFQDQGIFPSILVHSASLFQGEGLEQSPQEGDFIDFSNKLFQVNLLSPITMDHLYLKYWSNQSTSTETHQVIYFLDQRIDQAKGERHIYSLTKKSLRDHMLQLAESQGSKIRFNGIAPGLILPPPGRDNSHLEGLAPQVPMQRHGGPEDIQLAFDYLINSKFVQGQILYCDGGEHLRG